MPSRVLPNDDIVIATLQTLLTGSGNRRPAAILDLGGGTGVYAVPLAGQGHRVDVLDQSADALATLRRRAESAGVGDRVRARTADLDALDDAFTDGSADLVLCHRVLEYVDDPPRALAAARAALRPGGHLSILAASRTGAVLSHLIAGRFDEAAAALQSTAAGVHRRFDLVQLYRLLADAGFQAVQSLGIGLLGELNPAQSATPAAEALDRQVAEHRDLLAVAPLLHVIATPLR